MAWWQKKLLRFALARTGLLDDQALDLDNLGITLGKSNVVELKDVGLNIVRISKLAQLPPGVRVHTARVLSLRLTVPADIYQSSIVAEVDGVELCLRFEETESASEAVRKQKSNRAGSPAAARSPEHRKVHRRLHSPPPGSVDDLEAYIPTTNELAKSFLLEEPVQERRQLEASLALNAKGVEESFASESSGSDEVGIGAAVGLPGFLAGFLQGIVDRLQLSVKNVVATVEAKVGEDGEHAAPVTLKLRIGDVVLEKASTDRGNPGGRRNIKLSNISVDLATDAGIFDEFSDLTAPNSPILSRQLGLPSPHMGSPTGSSTEPKMSPTYGSIASTYNDSEAPSSRYPDPMQASIATADSDRFADARDDERLPLNDQNVVSTLDIQTGDDNITWGSRRNKSSAPAEDLWKSITSDDDLPASLLLERPSLSQENSSRGVSPNISRKRRNVSPYARNLQSPGSWPTLEEHPDRYQLQQSPGSWPTLDESQHAFFQPLTTEREPGLDAGVTDKQFPAGVWHSDESRPDPMDPGFDDTNEDLTMSRMYTHEEARSMYMSAMSHGPRMHVPGGWSPEETLSERSNSPQDTRTSGPPRVVPKSAPVVPAFDDDLAYGERPYATPKAPLSGYATPRASSPEPLKTSTSGSHATRQITKQLAHISTVSISVPANPYTEQQDQLVSSSTRDARKAVMHEMPGTFSAYSDIAASRGNFDNSRVYPRHGAGSMSNVRGTAEIEENAGSISIKIGSIACQTDVACCKLLHRLGSCYAVVLTTASGNMRGELTAGAEGRDTAIKTAVSLSVASLCIAFKDTVDQTLQSLEPGQNAPDGVATLSCQQIGVTTSTKETAVQIGTLRAYVGSSCLLSFDKTMHQDASVLLTEDTPDIAMSISKRFSVVGRSISEINVDTRPIIILLDLPTLDETFEFLGGLSSVLEAGNSILAESGIGSPPKPTKGVRFEAEPQREDEGSELKLNVRFGGVSATLQGSACYMRLRTSTVKAVYREQGVVVTVGQVQASGPHLPNENILPMSADLSAIHLEYLLSPQHKDLERLISLLTPSKDSYDTNDDILIETLLSQRRKGGIVKLAIGTAKAKCHDWSCLENLKDFSQELSRLAAVAKYLPEDDRPGILSLVRINQFDARIPVNERFGMLHTRLTDLQCAHVGLPALLALSVGGVQASQAGDVELVHPFVAPSSVDNLPMLMVRRLGDEIEPEVKIKLFNVAFEYSVPVLLDLTGLDREADTEEVVAELARSVTTLTSPTANKETEEGLPSSETPAAPKSVKLNLLIRESGLGLSPHGIPSKALLVLADASFSTSVPPEAPLSAAFEVRKAGLFIVDSAVTSDVDVTIVARGAPSNTAVKPKLTATLSRQGYVSVGSIMTMNISLHAQQSHQKDDEFITVDVKNELVLLETCADSTQTLIATLNGLTPPTPPSKQPKYLTEPMAIEDMMASFTGEPYTTPEQTRSTLFDIEEEQNDDPDPMFDMAAFEDDDDALLAESEMTSSLHGPVSGILGGVDKPEDYDDASEYFAETVERLLEDDPFEMTIPPPDAPLSDAALVRELDKQSRSVADDELVDLGLSEFEDLGYDALGAGQTALGTMHRFNTPATGGKQRFSRAAEVKLPFTLRLREMHVIWNIYDGYDWQRTRDGITEAVEQVEQRAELRKAKRRRSQLQEDDAESVIGDFLFNSIYIGVPSNQDAQELRRQINRHIDDMASETESVPMSGVSRPSAYSASGRPRSRRRLKLERSKVHKIAFELKGVSADVCVFPPDSAEVVSSVDIRVKDLEIFDNVPTSTWRKFLTHLDEDPLGREMSKPMAHIELLNVRTLENYAASELNIHVSVLPLRLHVDQDALDFITRFFEFKDEAAVSPSSPNDQPFIQRLEVDTVDLRLDYKPKTVDYAGLRSGHTNEFMNFIILDAANIRLKHAIIYGIKGFEPLHKTLNDIWMPDVKRNQLPTVLAGLAPVRSLVNIGSGVRDVVAIPIREYRKDGRIVRSIQKGAFSFGKTTASELARLGAKVAIGTQNLLQGAEGLLTPVSASPSGRPGPSRRSPSEPGWFDDDDEDHERRAISSYANQPLSVFGGLLSARRYLEHDLLTARDALIAVQGEVMESSSAGSAVAAVARHAPTVILRPIIGTSRAVGTALMGVGNAIDRDNVRRIDDKYKRR